MKKTLNIAIIGMGFMGRAHSNAWSQLNKFFDTEYEICLKAVAGKMKNGHASLPSVEAISYTTDWHTLLEREDIDVIDDILAPTYLQEMAVAAVKPGKHVICEKRMLSYLGGVSM